MAFSRPSFKKQKGYFLPYSNPRGSQFQYPSHSQRVGHPGGINIRKRSVSISSQGSISVRSDRCSRCGRIYMGPCEIRRFCFRCGDPNHLRPNCPLNRTDSLSPSRAPINLPIGVDRKVLVLLVLVHLDPDLLLLLLLQ